MDDIGAVQGSKLTWTASILALEAVGLGCCCVVRRKEADIFCIASDAYVVHYCQHVGRRKMKNEFVPKEER